MCSARPGLRGGVLNWEIGYNKVIGAIKVIGIIAGHFSHWRLQMTEMTCNYTLITPISMGQKTEKGKNYTRSIRFSADFGAAGRVPSGDANAR